METAMAMEKVTHSAALLFVQSHQKGATKKHKRHKEHITAEESLLCYLCLLCFFVASSLLRGEFSFLLFVESLLIFLEPGFEIV